MVGTVMQALGDFMHFHVRSLLKAFAVVSVALCGATQAQTENYPTRPIRLIVGQSPGASTDTAAREIAKGLSERLKVAVIVENRPGANTIIASDLVAKAPPDGYTLLVSSSMNATNPWIYTSLPYDYTKDLKNIILLGEAPNLMVSSNKSSIKNLNDLIEHAKKNPGAVNYGSAGVGSVHHLLMEIIAQHTGIIVNHIPYKGGGPAMKDVVSGTLDLYFGTISSTKSSVEQGLINPIFVTSIKRSKYMPNAETIAEHGIKGLESGYWLGLAGPAGLPDTIVNRLNQAVNEVLKDPRIIARLDQEAIEPKGGTVSEMDMFFKRELDFWKEAARAANVTPMETK